MENNVVSSEEQRLLPKPLSGNPFVAFWQRIGRWWQGVWYGFSEKHPKLAPWIYKIFFFLVFSYGVTIWQFIVMTFLPYAFQGLGTEPWGWPNAELSFAKDNGATYILFGDSAGLGYFIAYEIAVFTAQCINFPLQRNITYRSHGNPWWQAMWYFIGWVLVSVFTLAIWGLINVFFTSWGWYLPGEEGLATVAGLVKTVLTGGVSMVIFFFIFLIIFPDVDKTEKSKAAKLEAAKAALESAKASSDSEAVAKAELAVAKAELAYAIAVENRKLFHSEKNISAARSVAEARINAYQGKLNKIRKLTEQVEAAKSAGDAQKAEKLAKQLEEVKSGLEKSRNTALEAVDQRDKVVPEEEAVIAEVKQAREKRAAEKKVA